MSYGTLKVDNITYTNAGIDASTSVSGLVEGNFPNITITGTISGATITGNTGNFTTITAVTGIFTSTLSGATTTGITANFVSGVFTTQVSGATVLGPTHTGTTANFSSGNFTGTLSGATTVDSKGDVRSIPQNSQSSGYTLIATDAGKHIVAISGVTVPSGIMTVGDAVSIYNNTTGNITITQASGVTLRQAGASGTGNRTLAQYGLATVLCVSGTPGTVFVIGGAGIS